MVVVVVVVACAQTGSGQSLMSTIASFLSHHIIVSALARLAQLFTRMLCEHRIPKIWRQAKVIALEKPGKDPHLAAIYRPISLLSVCYKLLERTILQRILPEVEDFLSEDQAGFRSGRSTCVQVASLTTHTHTHTPV